MLKIELSPAFGGTARIWLRNLAELSWETHSDFMAKVAKPMDALSVWGGADKNEHKTVGGFPLLDMLSWEVRIEALETVVTALVRLLGNQRLQVENSSEACQQSRALQA